MLPPDRADLQWPPRPPEGGAARPGHGLRVWTEAQPGSPLQLRSQLTWVGSAALPAPCSHRLLGAPFCSADHTWPCPLLCIRKPEPSGSKGRVFSGGARVHVAGQDQPSPRCGVAGCLNTPAPCACLRWRGRLGRPSHPRSGALPYPAAHRAFCPLVCLSPGPTLKACAGGLCRMRPLPGQVCKTKVRVLALGGRKGGSASSKVPGVEGSVVPRLPTWSRFLYRVLAGSKGFQASGHHMGKRA